MKLAQILHFLAPNFVEGGPPEFLDLHYKGTHIAITWQSLTAIGRASSEIAWRKKIKKELEIGVEPNVRPPGAASPAAETILGGSNSARSNERHLANEFASANSAYTVRAQLV